MKNIVGGYYHFFNRGCNREPIFFSDDNYLHLLHLIHRFLPPSVSVVAYCLMSNHYHMLLKSMDSGSCSRFLQSTFSAYTQAVNRQRKRHGTLFERRAKGILVDDEKYAIYLCRYIHLNPVVARIAPSPLDWPYSNYAEFVGKRQGTLFDRQFVEAHCGNAAAYEGFVMSSLAEAIAAKIAKYCAD
jgi:REP element-mobilizing transposase RayT